MNAKDEYFARDAHVDAAVVNPLPRSRKLYVEGSRPDLRVPMREIEQSDTPASFGSEKNPAITVYDTSGPYTDPAAAIDLRKGLAPLRAAWIEERGDTARPRRPHLGLRPRAARRRRARGAALRARPPAAAGQARRQRHADALRAPRHRHARDGVRRDPREPAPRGDARRAAGRGDPPAPRAVLRRGDPRRDHARVRARRGGARPRDHPGQHQPPGDRADDHRPQLPGEDQREHRQLGRHARRSRRKSRRWCGRSAGARTR